MRVVRKNGRVVGFRMGEEEVEEMYGSGLCLGCGRESSCVEPDGREYPCKSCGENRVFGVEELVLMGKVVIREWA